MSCLGRNPFFIRHLRVSGNAHPTMSNNSLRTPSTLWCGMELHKNRNAQSTNPTISTPEVCAIFADFTFLR
jgi:hypothetical protein